MQKNPKNKTKQKQKKKGKRDDEGKGEWPQITIKMYALNHPKFHSWVRNSSCFCCSVPPSVITSIQQPYFLFNENKIGHFKIWNLKEIFYYIRLCGQFLRGEWVRGFFRESKGNDGG